MLWRTTVRFSGSSFQSEKLAALNRLPTSKYGRMRAWALQPLIQLTELPVPAMTIDGGSVPIELS